MKETLTQAGYVYVCYDRETGLHVLRSTDTGKLELWGVNKHHASYGLIWRNTHLEFIRGKYA